MANETQIIKQEVYHPVSKPQHYNMGDVETIQIILEVLGQEGFRSYCEGNYIKYISRAPFSGKADIDIQKAKTYKRWAETGRPD